MYPSARPAPTSAPPPPPNAHSSPTAGTDHAFLANPPKHKHKPQPIAVRCIPPRTLPRSTSSRRRASISASPAFPTSFLALIDTPTPDTPKTPHLTTHGYTTAFATSYPRRGSLSDVHQPRLAARRVPSSPKRVSAPSSPKSAGYPRRRQHRVSPPSPFAPPSPTRTYPRSRAESTTRIPAPAPVGRMPKLSKIRSLTNIRALASSPGPPSRSCTPKPAMSTSATSTPVPKSTSKRAKRSATPARGSAAYTKYRPMPFIQQMQMIQFLEGGSLDSHIRRHHIHAGQGTAHTGFATGPNVDVAHGYAFTDERGMIWFDEEEEWEFACLLPRVRTQGRRRRGIKRLLGKRQVEDSEDEWEEFVDDDGDELEVDPEVLLAREDDDLHAGDDDLTAFGGALEGAWAMDRPGRSVLNLPGPKEVRKPKRKRTRRTGSITPAIVPGQVSTPNHHVRTTVLKREFLATAFAPPPAHTSPAPAPARNPGPFRIFTRAPTPTDDRSTGSSRTLFRRNHRYARSVPNVGKGQSFTNLGSTLRGGDVLDLPAELPSSPTVQWAGTDQEHLLTGQPLGTSPAGSRASSPARSHSPAVDPHRTTPSPSPSPAGHPHFRSVSPPPAAARRLGIDPSTAVSLQPMVGHTKRTGFMSVRGFKNAR